MTRLRVLLSRIRALFRSSAMDGDLRDEIRAHLEEAVEEHQRRGLSAADARRAALLEFGSVTSVEEAHRDARAPWMRDVGRDVHYALRMLRRTPTFAAIAIGSLAIGIGANTAVFSLVNSVLFRPRPVADPDRLVEVYVGDRERPYDACSYPSYLDLRDRNGVFTGLAAYGIRQFKLGDANEVEQVWGEVVSSNYFDVLGVPPAIGRGFVPAEDEVPGRNPVAVISHGLWNRRFNADPAIIGRTMALNGELLTVIGIVPAQYTGSLRGLASDVWVPAMMLPRLEPRGEAWLTRRSRGLTLVGRMKSGISIAQARARFEVLSREMQAAHPEEWRSMRAETGTVRELFVSIVSERDSRVHPSMREGVYAGAALLFAIVNLALLIACMNLAGMLLARAVTRRREMAIRLAIGAGRLRLVRQLVTESLLLSLIAGGGGIVLAAWILGLLIRFMPALPEGIRIAIDLGLDWRVFAFAFGFSTLTGALFGLAPALHGSRTQPSAVLKDDAAAFTSSHVTSRWRTALVVGQVAFSLLLLVAAALVLRSVDNVRPTRLGFVSDQVVVASLSLDEPRYNRARAQEFYRQLADRVGALPGVQTVTLVEGMPGGFMSGMRRSTEIEGYQPGSGEDLQLDANFVGPRYFTSMKIPIVEGRDFDERDREGASCVAIVNEVFARRYFGGGSPLGKHLAKFEFQPAPVKSPCAIVGVVRDDRWQSLQKERRPFYWLAVQQALRRRITLLVATTADPAAHVTAVRAAVQSLDPKMPVADIQTLNQYFSATAYPFRLLAIVLGGCGVLALVLATLGIYGIISYSVAQRTREVGIRMALGALGGDIMKKVVGEGMMIACVGLTVGLLVSAALTRVLTSTPFESELLFGVDPIDPISFTAVTLALALVAAVACYIPARRAARLDPIAALRSE